MRVSMYEGLPGKKGVKRRLCTVQGGAAAPICQRRGIGGAVISYGGGATLVDGPHHWTPHLDDVRGGRGHQSSFRPAGSPAPEVSVFAPNGHISEQTWWRPWRTVACSDGTGPFSPQHDDDTRCTATRLARRPDELPPFLSPRVRRRTSPVSFLRSPSLSY